MASPWLKWQVIICMISSCVWDRVVGQIRYSIPEELKHGAFVGNIADDLGLNVRELSARRFRIVPGANTQFLEVNLENGVLFVNEKMDREQLCELSPSCFLHLEIVIENPLELYRVEVEILDVNDNSPGFPWREFRLEIAESVALGARFPLESAHDPDVGTNSLQTYRLSPNPYFSLEVQTRSERSKFPVLVLDMPLDRESQGLHQLVLTALDGGFPERSGTALLTVVVLDVNDNAPVFDQAVYTVCLVENAPRNTLVIKLNATDFDQGSNGEVTYSFSHHAPVRLRQLFRVEPRTGEIRVQGVVDYEEASVYEIYIQAKDNGPHTAAVHCTVVVEVIDVNDNAPEVTLTSVSSPVREDALPGTVIALISVSDRDSGANGKTSCRIPAHVPFKLQSSFKNYYTLVTSERLDRESVLEYNVSLTVTDSGSPPLSTVKTIPVKVSDVNDNAPRFAHPSYTVYLMENNAPGASICSVSALDPDLEQNAYVSYCILNSKIRGTPISTYVSINLNTGNLYALRSFDYEQLKKFQVWVQAWDAGFPSLHNNVTVNVIILDQNDNAPAIVSPLPLNGSAERVPRSADPGYPVAKVTAVDADSGQNSRLSYQLYRATEPGLFSIGPFTGEIRTSRRFEEHDSRQQRLVVHVIDHGKPPLSSSVTINVFIVDSLPEDISDLSEGPQGIEYFSEFNLYLIVSLGSISFVFLVAIIALISIKCHRGSRHGTLGRRCSLSASCCCCCCLRRKPSRAVLNNSHTNFQLPPSVKGPPSCMEVGGSGSLSQTYCYKVCLSPESAKTDLMFLKPYSSPTPAAGANSKLAQPYVSAWRRQISGGTNGTTNGSSEATCNLHCHVLNETSHNGGNQLLKQRLQIFSTNYSNHNGIIIRQYPRSGQSRSVCEVWTIWNHDQAIERTYNIMRCVPCLPSSRPING
ncbi:protocadherin-10-like isoform X1 [Chiloscyllium punctatum]|uniref:protocadherin-10-like isoform X1 n=1 Tax=Chiloscyllium punctatum TaxID=137246 RepID=UPI003B642979